MSAKPKSAKCNVESKPDPQALQFHALEGETESDTVGRNVVLPIHSNAITIKSYSAKFGDDVPLMGLVNALRSQAKEVHGGDLKRTETMLIAQAHTLDAIFNNLAQRAALNLGEYIGAADTYLRLALKAQSQCRTTLETLATIKNPPVVYAKQANFATGPQQVNNGANLPTNTRADARTRETDNQQSKLLEQQPNEWLDTGAASAPSGSDQTLETVGAGNRT
jgi:hypothetical protein